MHGAGRLISNRCLPARRRRAGWQGQAELGPRGLSSQHFDPGANKRGEARCISARAAAALARRGAHTAARALRAPCLSTPHRFSRRRRPIAATPCVHACMPPVHMACLHAPFAPRPCGVAAGLPHHQSARHPPLAARRVTARRGRARMRMHSGVHAYIGVQPRQRETCPALARRAPCGAAPAWGQPPPRAPSTHFVHIVRSAPPAAVIVSPRNPALA
jgi:hypothetical protein